MSASFAYGLLVGSLWATIVLYIVDCVRNRNG
jgi:hypothetical protein